MVRRTVTLPDDLDRRIRELAHEGESFSAAVSRYLERGLDHLERLKFAGTGHGEADDSARVEELVGEILDRIHDEEKA